MNGSERSNATSSSAHKLHNPWYRTKLCRNYPLGTCRYGDYCSYLHISSTTQLAPPMHTIARSVFYPALSIPPLTPNDPLPGEAYMSTYAGTGTGSGTYSSPQTYTPNGRTRAPRPAVPKRGHISPRNSASASNPEVPSRNVEKWRQSISVDSATCGDATCSACPPAPPATPVSAFTPAPSSGWTYEERWSSTVWGNPWQTGSGTETPLACPLPLSPQSSRQPQGMSKLVRHRNQFFKTKPCRFYGEPSGCIKGDRCNFIHENPDEGRRPSGFTARPADVVSDCEVESGAESSVQEVSSPSTAPTSAHEVSESSATHFHSEGHAHLEGKKNFYPVTWRVVGGGVMMSGRREICENFMAGHCAEGADCRFAHPDTNEEDYLATYPEPPPIYSPISPMLSPVVFAYPVVYPTLSAPQPFALPAMSGHGHVQSAPPVISPSETPVAKNARAHSVRPTLTITPVPQPSGPSYPYNPNRIVDGSTLLQHERQHPNQAHDSQREEGLRPDGVFPARTMVRPVSTPPTPVQGYDTGVARLFAAEMP